MSLPVSEYQKRIIDYYQASENAYKDAWDLDQSHAIHYGYWDEKVKTFPQSLLRMNEVMMDAAAISPADNVLDAGCGIGGSSFFLAEKRGCSVTGITLSERQVQQATILAVKKKLEKKVGFKVMDFTGTSFPSESFDVVWACESSCYAESKEEFVTEAWRLLKPGGRLVVTDGFVTDFTNNDNPVIRQWLDGWQVNYLESPQRFQQFMQQAGFENISCRNISAFTAHSSRRLYRFYFLASLYHFWKTITFRNRATTLQKQNITACKYQYLGMKKNLWQYGLITGRKPL